MKMVQLAVFSFHVAQKGLRAQTDAGHALGKMVGREHATPSMNLLAEPAPEHHELSRGDFVFQVRNLKPCLIEELHGVQVP